jgi:hypothetical protein
MEGSLKQRMPEGVAETNIPADFRRNTPGIFPHKIL